MAENYVRATVMLDLANGERDEFIVVANGNNSDKNDRATNSVTQSAVIKLSTGSFSRIDRIPPRVVSQYDDDGHGQRFKFFMRKNDLRKKCGSDSGVELVIQQNGTGKAGLVGGENDGEYKIFDEGEFGSGSVTFDLEGADTGLSDEIQSTTMDDTCITAYCKGSGRAKKIDSEKFSVAALPKDFELYYVSSTDECFKLDKPATHAGADVMWRWQSDSGKVEDLNKTRIWESYFEYGHGYKDLGGNADKSCSGYCVGEFGCECIGIAYCTTSDERVADINTFYVGNKDHRLFKGRHMFMCGRSGFSGLLSRETDIWNVERKDEERYDFTLSVDMKCAERCSNSSGDGHSFSVNKICPETFEPEE